MATTRSCNAVPSPPSSAKPEERIWTWRTPRAVYWVSNTLSETLNNKQMLAIARSLSRFGGK